MRSIKRYSLLFMLLISLLLLSGCSDTALRYGIHVDPLKNSYNNIANDTSKAFEGLYLEEVVTDEESNSGYLSGMLIHESYTILVQFTLTYSEGKARTCYVDISSNIYDIESENFINYLISYATPFFSSALNAKLDITKQVKALAFTYIDAEKSGILIFDGSNFVVDILNDKSLAFAYRDTGEYNTLSLALNMPITASIQSVTFFSLEDISTYKTSIAKAKPIISWSGVTEFTSEPFTPKNSVWFISVKAEKTSSPLNNFTLTILEAKSQTILDTVEFVNGKPSTIYEKIKMLYLPSGKDLSYVIKIKTYGYTWQVSALW